MKDFGVKITKTKTKSPYRKRIHVMIAHDNPNASFMHQFDKFGQHAQVHAQSKSSSECGTTSFTITPVSDISFVSLLSSSLFSGRSLVKDI